MAIERTGGLDHRSASQLITARRLDNAAPYGRQPSLWSASEVSTNTWRTAGGAPSWSSPPHPGRGTMDG